ncbi:MAG: family 78 glycoside hydrolase catalytic domain [Planctomycetia bacterium]|nr:family 78 glycoside hydrolase catalytic domain [Planctomycetia bacterium]
MMLKFDFRSILRCSLSLLFVLMFSAFCFSGTEAKTGTIFPYDLTVESLTDPAGIDTPAPRFCWKSKSVSKDAYDLEQSAYQVLVASSKEKLNADQGDLWDSEKVNSRDSLYIVYKGKKLETSQFCFWKIRVWDQKGNPSKWSKPGQWITGIMDPADWSASWIGQSASMRPEINLSGAHWIGSSDKNAKSIFLHKNFELNLSKEDLEKKDLYALFRFAGNQKFEIYVNGEKAGYSIGMVYNPDLLRTIDLSERLVSGKNLIAISLTDKETSNPVGFLGRLEVGKIDKSGIPEKNRALTRRGLPKEPFFVLNTDSSWSVSDKPGKDWKADPSENGWTKAVVLFDPDGGPWGKVRRIDEKESPLFQKKFTLKKKIKQAVLHITGLGFYEASLNGKKIGEKLLDPAPTNFNKSVLYSTYDLTGDLKKGIGKEQDLSVQLGHGWYDVRAIVTWNFDAAPWRDYPRMIAQIDLVYEDGSKEKIVSDANWSVLQSPFLFDCIRQGEIIDANRKSKVLGKAVVVPAPKGRLKAEVLPPVITTEIFKPASIRKIADQVQIVDLGRNIAGWCAVKIRNSQKGDVVRFRYSERIDEKGAIERKTIEMHFMEGTSSLIAGEIGRFQTDYYICEGKPVEIFEPRFTYNGFQYLEITGLRGDLRADDIDAKIVHNDFKKIGSFRCDNELLNKIQEATLLSYRGNFVDGYPTDCPHREKNGWTGDAHLAAEQAMYNWENTAAYEKWIGDLRDEQQPDGNLPGIVPSGGWGYRWGNGPAWDSSLILIPWYLYVYRNDQRVLTDAYDAMKLYLSYMDSKAVNNLVSHGLGDWIPVKTKTPVEITSTGFYYVDTMIVAHTALILGKKEEAAHYYKKAAEIKKAYLAKNLDSNGICANGSQTAQSTLLHQGFGSDLDSGLKEKVFENLTKAVKKSDNYPDFGIMGAKYLFRTLSENGRTDLALAMILKEKQPSYADWIRRGGGTLWEDWKEGSSRNHIMFGDISAWFYQSLAGIKLGAGADLAAAQLNDIDSLGFKSILIEPKCCAKYLKDQEKKIRYADANIDSPYGPIRSAWRWNRDYTELTVDITVPVNSQAVVSLPSLGEKMKAVKGNPKILKSTENNVRYLLGSGNWRFSSK